MRMDSIGSDNSRSTTSALGLDSEPQGQGEGDLGPGVESLCCGHGDLRAAEHSLEASHEVVVTDQAKLAAFGESQAHLDGFGQVLQVGL